jgi:hypothetical protein
MWPRDLSCLDGDVRSGDFRNEAWTSAHVKPRSRGGEREPASRSNEKAGKQLPGESNNNL